MKKRTLLMIICIVVICNVSFAGPLFMAKARFATKDLNGISKYGTIYDLIGVYDHGYSGQISVFNNTNEFVDFETAILTGINDTENPDEKLLTFIFRVEDGGNYIQDNYDYSNYNIDNLTGLLSFATYNSETSYGVKALDDDVPIFRYEGEIPEEEIERLLFVGTGKKYERKQ